MANGSDMTLSAKLEVKDSFTSQLNKFKNALNNTENAFTKFVNKIDQSSQKMEKTLDNINKKMEQTSNKIISQGDKVANSIIKSSDKVEQRQNKVTEDLLKKYTKMGGDIQTIFKNVQKEADQLNKTGVKVNFNGGSNKLNNGSGSNGILGDSKSESFLTALIGGNFTRMLGTLGIIGGAITGATKILTTLDGWAQQGFNAINTLSTGLLSVNGLKDAVNTSSEFETNRVALDTLYGNNKQKGQEYYQIGTKLAKETPYSESDVGALQKKLAGSGVEYKSQDLMTILDMASVKPELGAEHAGFSIIDAMFGRTTSLKTNYMIDSKEMQKYLKKLSKGNSNDKANAKSWKDAFNAKGSDNNKQEYFDLLIDYVQKETSFNGLTEKYSRTMSGMMDRLSGNWETLRADLLGIDANNTGMVKPGKITVFSALEDGMKNIEKWLSDDSTKVLLDDVGEGLGKAINAISNSLSNFLKKVDWDKVGKVFEKIGDSIAKLIDKITSSPEFMKLIDDLPTLIDKTLNNKVVDTTTDIKTGTDLANGDVVGAGIDLVKGKTDKWYNLIGSNSGEEGADTESWSNKLVYTLQGVAGTQSYNKAAHSADDYFFLTDANASTVLSNNPTLNDNQREQIQDMMKKDNTPTYNVTIGTIQANSFDEIVSSLQKYQTNKK